MEINVGLFLDLRNPSRWHRDWTDHYAQTLERVVWAESLGADAIWMSEHHMFRDGYLPQPLTFAAAVAARTSRVRVGTAVTLAAIRHPRHLAEEAAIVDLLSGGRLELGIGAGSSTGDYAAFGIEASGRYAATDSTVAELRRLVAEGEIMPPPLQDPLPIWLGYQGPQGARRAGRLGTGLLALRRELLAPYVDGLEEAGHSATEARMGGVIDLIVSSDPEEAARRVLPHWVEQQNSYTAASRGPDCGQSDMLVEAELRATLENTGRIPGLMVLTADDAVAQVRKRTMGLPVQHVYFWLSIAGMPDDLVQDHVELALGVVRPQLAKAP